MPEREPEPEPILFACLGCGALNPPDAPACSGCGHAFGRPAAPDPAPGRPARRPPRLIGDEPPYVPPPARPGSQVVMAVFLVAAVAACVGAFSVHAGWGILASIALGPASVALAVSCVWRNGQGRPMAAGEMVGTFLLASGLSFAVVAAGLIAFAMTCVPAGVVSGDPEVAAKVGWVAAVGSAIVFGSCGVWVLAQAARRMAGMDAKAGANRPGPRIDGDGPAGGRGRQGGER